MKLYQISEPQDNELVVGIDLGTTNSLIGYYEGNTIQIVPDKYNEDGVVPSVVAYTDNQVKVGYEALLCEKNIRSIKRLIGKGLNDNISAIYDIDINESSKEILKLTTNSKSVSPIEISSEILKYLKKNAEEYTKKIVTKAVITVPAHFDDAARTATRNAARIAGIEVLRILNEPTAAAIAYDLNMNENEEVLVYDLGGGTFDVSIVKKNHGVLFVIATCGDNNLGGDDFDYEILKLLCNKAQIEVSLDYFKIAIDCKKYLSEYTSWQGSVAQRKIMVSRTEIEKVCQKLIERTLVITEQIILESKAHIKQVVLAGGATRMPIIKHKIEKMFHCKALCSIDPDQVVTIGAVLQAKSMTSEGSVLVDVLPLSLGIELMGEIVEVIIPRNTTIPIIAKKFFTTYKDNQTGFKVHVLQGEGQTVKECRSLGRFELNGIPAKPAGQVKLEVIFKVDANGLLIVTATELDTGNFCEIEVKPSYGLSENEILKLIKL